MATRSCCLWVLLRFLDWPCPEGFTNLSVGSVFAHHGLSGHGLFLVFFREVCAIGSLRLGRGHRAERRSDRRFPRCGTRAGVTDQTSYFVLKVPSWSIAAVSFFKAVVLVLDWETLSAPKTFVFSLSYVWVLALRGISVVQWIRHSAFAFASLACMPPGYRG